MTGSRSMSPVSPDDARAWLARWDRQQEGYVRGREARFAVMAEAEWTHWSSIKELRVHFDNAKQHRTRHVHRRQRSGNQAR